MNSLVSKKMIEEKLLERIVILVFILMSILLLTITFASGQVSIENIDMPESLDEGSELVVSMIASSDIIDDEIDYRIYLDGELVSEYDYYQSYVNYSCQGEHLVVFYVADSESNISETRSFNVTDNTMSLSFINPQEQTYNSREIDISISVSTYADTCYYILNGSEGELTGSEQEFSGSVLLGVDGSYLLYINCSNIYESASAYVKFNIDTQNPVIVSKSYSLDEESVTMSVVTDKICTCRYDISDKPYDNMFWVFSNTNNVQHHTSVEGLIEGSYSYFIRCMSVNGNIGNSDTISFTLITKPSATISLSKSSPLKAGTYDVTLRTSEPVSGAPSLYYTFNTDTSPRYVTLTGSGRDWKGYMIVGDDVSNVVGTFHYSGVDQNNNVGNIITEGQLFLIDTSRPEAPGSVEAKSESDGSIELRWYYDGEEVKRFNIYRSDDGDPEYVDYYDSTILNKYVDEDTVEGITYYYRIAAVDKAENDGLLSSVLEAESSRIVEYDDEKDEIVVVQRVLDTSLLPKIDQLIELFKGYIIDIDAAKSEFDEIDDPTKLKVINMLKLSENANSARDTINDLMEQVKSLKNQDMKESELDVKLNKLKMDAIKAKSSVVEDIIIDEQASYDQITQKSDVDEAVSEAVSVNLSRSVLDDYSTRNIKLQDSISVNSEVIIFKIKYVGLDDYDRYTLVKKTVSSSQELSNISIIELVPKSFEREASDIMFDIEGQKMPIIVKEDPVIRWDSDAFTKQTIYYMINSHAEMTSARATKTVVLYRPDFKVTQTAEEPVSKRDGITGLVGIESAGINKISGIQWTIVLGIGLIVVLSTYYVSLDRKEKKRTVQRFKDHKILPQASQSSLAKHIDAKKTSSAQFVISSVPDAKNMPADFEHMMGQLDKANELINNFDYENARSIYNFCMQIYSKSEFKDSREKDEIRLMLNHIYLKLNAYSIIYSSRKHVVSKNYNLIKKDVDTINKICRRLYDTLDSVDEDYKDNEQKFLDYVVNSKKHLEATIS
ncbi:MAG: hypothetical protein ACP5NW_04775 [Candidatus Woesearchaeota archaeon]